MSVEAVAVAGLAAAFVVVNGANDGASLLSLSLRIPGVPPIAGIAGIAAALFAVPFFLTTNVARTLAGRLVDAETGGGVVVIAAIVATIAVVGVLTRRGLPTSLTLATVGGLVGAGLGAGLAVSWRWAAIVLSLAAAAPFVSLVVGWLGAMLFRVRTVGGAGKTIRWVHLAGFALICLAYAANDGQKMLAIFAIAGLGGLDATLGVTATIVGLFVVGTVLSIRRVSRTLGSSLVRVRPVTAVIAETSAATVVLATAALGAPVSMTQSIAGGLIGSSVKGGLRTVRWRTALRIGNAWLLTLPAAFGVAYLMAFGLEGIA